MQSCFHRKYKSTREKGDAPEEEVSCNMGNGIEMLLACLHGPERLPGILETLLAFTTIMQGGGIQAKDGRGYGVEGEIERIPFYHESAPTGTFRPELNQH